MNLDYSQTAVGQTKALSGGFACPIWRSLSYGHLCISPFFLSLSSGMRTNFQLYQLEGLGWLGNSFFCSCCSGSFHSIISSCFFVTASIPDFSWSSTGGNSFITAFGLLSNLSGFLVKGPAFTFQSWVVPVSVLFFDWSQLFITTFIKEAKYLPDLATLNLFEYEGLQHSIDLFGSGDSCSG